jgi:hypothetical protein
MPRKRTSQCARRSGADLVIIHRRIAFRGRRGPYFLPAPARVNLWAIVAVDAAVVAGEYPCVLLISSSHEGRLRLMPLVDAAGCVERQPQQHGTEHQDAGTGRDPHPIADGQTKKDQRQKRRDERCRAGVVVLVRAHCSRISSGPERPDSSGTPAGRKSPGHRPAGRSRPAVPTSASAARWLMRSPSTNASARPVPVAIWAGRQRTAMCWLSSPKTARPTCWSHELGGCDNWSTTVSGGGLQTSRFSRLGQVIRPDGSQNEGRIKMTAEIYGELFHPTYPRLISARRPPNFTPRRCDTRFAGIGRCLS